MMLCWSRRMVGVYRALNQMIRTGQLGGWNLMPLIFRLMMKRRAVLLCSFRAMDVIVKRWWRIQRTSFWVPLGTCKTCILLRVRNTWNIGCPLSKTAEFHDYEAFRLALTEICFYFYFSPLVLYNEPTLFEYNMQKGKNKTKVKNKRNWGRTFSENQSQEQKKPEDQLLLKCNLMEEGRRIM